ncbi:hypothetical protein [Gimesia chilikensis]|uniref:hypothetical protein n=1 Tax=Gimesia chilikensis TaxID=2605989 RepID=UPI003A8F4E17
MSSFTDTKGEAWTISINLGTALKLKQELEIDLLAEMKTPEGAFKYIASLDDDRFKLGQIIYILAKPTTPGKTQDELFEAMDQEVAEAAYLALMEAVIDFFPKSLREQMRTVFNKSMAIHKENREGLLELSAEMINSPELEKRIRSQIHGEISSDQPASSV